MTLNLSDGASQGTAGPLTGVRSVGNIPAMMKKEKGELSPRLQGEDLVPAYSKFKAAFESLLEGQDFSKKKKETLQKMSKEQKWTLLTQYKDSTLYLLVCWHPRTPLSYNPYKFVQKKDVGSPNFSLRRNKPIVFRNPKDFCAALTSTLTVHICHSSCS